MRRARSKSKRRQKRQSHLLQHRHRNQHRNQQRLRQHRAAPLPRRLPLPPNGCYPQNRPPPRRRPQEVTIHQRTHSPLKRKKRQKRQSPYPPHPHQATKPRNWLQQRNQQVRPGCRRQNRQRPARSPRQPRPTSGASQPPLSLAARHAAAHDTQPSTISHLQIRSLVSNSHKSAYLLIRVRSLGGSPQRATLADYLSPLDWSVRVGRDLSCQALKTWTIKTPVPRTPPLCYTPHARVREQ